MTRRGSVTRIAFLLALSGCGNRPEAMPVAAASAQIAGLYKALGKVSGAERAQFAATWRSRSISAEAAHLLPYLTDAPVRVGPLEFTHMRSAIIANLKLFAALDKASPGTTAFLGIAASAAGEPSEAAFAAGIEHLARTAALPSGFGLVSGGILETPGLVIAGTALCGLACVACRLTYNLYKGFRTDFAPVAGVGNAILVDQALQHPGDAAIANHLNQQLNGAAAIEAAWLSDSASEASGFDSAASGAEESDHDSDSDASTCTSGPSFGAAPRRVNGPAFNEYRYRH